MLPRLQVTLLTASSQSMYSLAKWSPGFMGMGTRAPYFPIKMTTATSCFFFCHIIGMSPFSMMLAGPRTKIANKVL